MAYGFNPYGGRTDGREIRPHKPWMVNTGVETANRTVVRGPSTPRTDFKTALTPRLGGLMKPQFDFRTDVQKGKDFETHVAQTPFLQRLRSDANYYGVNPAIGFGAGREIRSSATPPLTRSQQSVSWSSSPDPDWQRGANDNLWEKLHPLGIGASESMRAMEGAANLSIPSDAPKSSMFSGVDDSGSVVSDGWVSTGTAEQKQIRNKFAPKPQFAIGGTTNNLPY